MFWGCSGLNNVLGPGHKVLAALNGGQVPKHDFFGFCWHATLLVAYNSTWSLWWFHTKVNFRDRAGVGYGTYKDASWQFFSSPWRPAELLGVLRAKSCMYVTVSELSCPSGTALRFHARRESNARLADLLNVETTFPCGVSTWAKAPQSIALIFESSTTSSILNLNFGFLSPWRRSGQLNEINRQSIIFLCWITMVRIKLKIERKVVPARYLHPCYTLSSLE